MFQNKLLIKCIIVVCVCVSGKTAIKFANSEGYYWRDYAGYIPADAMPGGHEDNKATYLGQALFRNIYVPAKIKPGEGKAIFEWGNKYHNTTENIKILCTNYVDRFHWLISTSNKYKNREKFFVLAALEGKDLVYFGRIHQDGDVIVGKVVDDFRQFFHTEYKGEVLRSTSFEVLVYDEEKTSNAVTHSKSQKCSCYYWREYAGQIPPDVIKGGVEKGTTTYLAQTLFKNLYVPAKLRDGKAYFEWGNEVQMKTDNIKLLCTNHIERFFWLKTTSNKFRSRTEPFVVAALEGNNFLYFGRAKYDEDVVAGKVLADDSILLHAVHNGQVVRNDSFDVLRYKPPTTASPSTTNNTSKCNCKKRVALNFYTC